MVYVGTYPRKDHVLKWGMLSWLVSSEKSLLMAKDMKSKASNYMNTKTPHQNITILHWLMQLECQQTKYMINPVKTLPKRHILGFSSRSAAYYMIQYLVWRFWNRLETITLAYIMVRISLTLLCCVTLGNSPNFPEPQSPHV